MTPHVARFTHLIAGLSLAAGLLCAAPNASAQSSASVTIPFGFSIGGQYIPAGAYRIESLPGGSMAVRSLETSKTKVLMVRRQDAGGIATRGRLVFQQVGADRYLSQVWIAGSSLYSEIPVHPKTFREMPRPVRQLADNPPSIFELPIRPSARAIAASSR